MSDLQNIATKEFSERTLHEAAQLLFDWRFFYGSYPKTEQEVVNEIVSLLCRPSETSE